MEIQSWKIPRIDFEAITDIDIAIYMFVRPGGQIVGSFNSNLLEIELKYGYLEGDVLKSTEGSRDMDRDTY